MVSLEQCSLALFFTRGMSLQRWGKSGILDREVALYRRLSPHLNKIAFVTYGGRSETEYASHLDGISIVSNRWGLPKRRYIQYISKIRPMAWDGHTIIKSNQFKGADVAAAVAERFGNKFVARCGYLYSEFMEHRHGKESPEAAEARDLEGRVFAEADKVVVTTPSMRKEVVTRYEIPEGRVVVIPNYVLTDLFRPIPSKQRLPRRMCFVGRLDKQKNPLALLDAIKGLDIELIMVGSGPLEGLLQKKARDENLPVRFLGNVPHGQLPEILNSASLFVLPSHYEGHPKTMLEAMACGLPVIGTDVPGIRELIEHRETGYLCGTTVEEIRSAIEEVMEDPDLCFRLGRKAREFVVDTCSLERVAKMELSMLQETVKEE
jgi:glycosyltransferase involved in cell wall biosynthesis